MNKKELKQHLVCEYCKGDTFGDFRTIETIGYAMVGGLAMEHDRQKVTMCSTCWDFTPNTMVVTEDDPAVPHYLQAALFREVVVVGQVNPQGEAAYKGYQRQQFMASDQWNLDDITFPAAEEDYRDDDGEYIYVKCLAALDANNIVVGVKLL